jgi:putative ABC transport system permease protein
MLRRLSNLFRRRRAERELDEEMAFHVEQQTAENLEAGMGPLEARNAALRTFGGLTQSKERCRETRGLLLLGALWADLRYALRTLAKSRAFTAATIATLALGIGANTAMFSVVESAILRPLPYRDSDRVLSLAAFTNGRASGSVAIPEFLTWRARCHAVDRMAAFTTREYNWTGIEIPERILAGEVTVDLLPMLGIQPVTGRAFVPEEGVPGGPVAVVLGPALAARLLPSGAIPPGFSLTLDGVPHPVVGVLPPGFRFPGSEHVDLLKALATPGAPDWNAGGFRTVRVLGHLRGGATPEQVRGELTAASTEVTAILAARFPALRQGLRISAVSLREALTGDVLRLLWVLSGAVAFILLIACVNVAHLALARVAARRGEMALRAALGASRGRLVRQLLTENLLLSLSGAAAGLMVAAAALRLLRTVAPASMPYMTLTELNATVLGFTLCVSVVAVLLFGLVPAFAGTDLQRQIRAGRNRFRSALMTGEVALALILLVGAGLLIRSYSALQSVDPGFRRDHLLTLRLRLPRQPALADNWRYAAFVHRAEAAIGALPGVVSVGAASSLPLTGYTGFANVTVTEGAAPSGGKPMIFEQRAGGASSAPLGDNTPMGSVTPDYFRAMGIPLLAGRNFDARDNSNSPSVAIVNRAFARRYIPTGDPFTKQAAGAQIVGIVGDSRHLGLDRDTMPEVFRPFDQLPLFDFAMVVQTATDPRVLAPQVRAAIASLDRNQPVADIATMEARFAGSLAPQRFQTTTLAILAALALALAAVGIYGVMAYFAARRTHEIGIRIALGAARGDVVWLIVRQALTAALAGSLVGVAGAVALTRFLKTFLYEVRPTDPATIAAAALGILVLALLATCLPALRASRASALDSLRHE